MHFNININLDKHKQGQPDVDVEEVRASEASPAESVSWQQQQQQQQVMQGGMSSPQHMQQQQQQQYQHHAGRTFQDQAPQPQAGVPHTGFFPISATPASNYGSLPAAPSPAPTGQTQQQYVQQQLQLRDLYSKFTLLQHKLSESNNNLLEAKSAVLKKDEEVLSRDQIIAVLTHTVRMKDREIAARDDEIARLRSEVQSLKQSINAQLGLPASERSPQRDLQRDQREVGQSNVDLGSVLQVLLQVMQGQQSLQGEKAESDGLRDRIISEQFSLLHELAVKATPAPQGEAQQLAPSTPKGKMDRKASVLAPSLAPSEPRRHSSMMRAHVQAPAVPRPPSVPSPAVGGVFDTPAMFEPAPAFPEHAPADRENTAIQVPNEEVSVAGLSNFLPTPAATPAHGMSAAPSIAMSMSRKESVASVHSVRSPGTPVGAPAEKPNTAIAVPGEIIDLESLLQSVNSLKGGEGMNASQLHVLAESLRSAAGSQAASRRTSQAATPTHHPAAKRNTAIEIPGEEVEINSQF